MYTHENHPCRGSRVGQVSASARHRKARKWGLRLGEEFGVQEFWIYGLEFRGAGFRVSSGV